MTITGDTHDVARRQAEMYDMLRGAMAARFGPDCAVEAKNIERPVEWARAGVTDVLLHIP